MLRGQSGWLKVGEAWHKGGYHTPKFLRKPYMDKDADVGQTIWIKVELCTIKRDSRCPNTANLETKLAFWDKVRGQCRELVGF